MKEPCHAIPGCARTNFETLVETAKAGDLARAECTEVKRGETRYVLCAVSRGADQLGGDCVMTPFSHLAPGNSDNTCVPPA